MPQLKKNLSQKTEIKKYFKMTIWKVRMTKLNCEISLSRKTIRKISLKVFMKYIKIKFKDFLIIQVSLKK